MLDIKFLRANPDIVKQNIKNKFQDSKLPLVDEVIALDLRNREIKQEVEALRAEKNKISKMIGACMAQGKKEEAEEYKRQVSAQGDTIEKLSVEEKEDNDSDNLCHSNGTEHTEFCTFFCTFVLSGAEVLADKGSQRQCKACDRQEAKSLDL